LSRFASDAVTTDLRLPEDRSTSFLFCERFDCRSLLSPRSLGRDICQPSQ